MSGFLVLIHPFIGNFNESFCVSALGRVGCIAAACSHIKCDVVYLQRFFDMLFDGRNQCIPGKSGIVFGNNEGKFIPADSECIVFVTQAQPLLNRIEG